MRDRSMVRGEPDWERVEKSKLSAWRRTTTKTADWRRAEKETWGPRKKIYLKLNSLKEPLFPKLWNFVQKVVKRALCLKLDIYITFMSIYIKFVNEYYIFIIIYIEIHVYDNDLSGSYFIFFILKVCQETADFGCGEGY